MEDITPQLVENVTGEFRRLYDASAKISGLLAKVKAKTATYAEAQEYAIEVSRLIGRAWEKYVSSATLPDGRMYYNIASRLVPAALDENHALVAQYAADVQKGLNDRAGIGLKPQMAELDQDRVDGLVELASSTEQYDEVAGRLLSDFENFSQHIVDETIRKNADFHYRSGLSPKLIRQSHGKCCAWCRSLAGTHDYPDVDRDVYRRHRDCRCTVLYDPADGTKKLQNVHTKMVFDAEAAEHRKQIEGIDTSRNKVITLPNNSAPTNVTAEYLRRATPGVGTIHFEEGYIRSKHTEEVRIAKWLLDNFGGDIALINESAINGEKRADYLWNGALWDLKSITSAKAADSAVRKGIKQIFNNPGGIILDIGEHEVSVENMLSIVHNRMKRSNELEADIILVKQNKFYAAYRYRK